MFNMRLKQRQEERSHNLEKSNREEIKIDKAKSILIFILLFIYFVIIKLEIKSGGN